MKYLPRRLHLRNRTDFERCTDKVNSGISRSQRLLNNGNHLCSFRIQRQDAFGRRDAERVWTGSRKRRSQQCAHIAGFLAEMKRFELLRRFEADLPHFECVRNFRTWRNLTEAEGSCGNPKKPEFPRVLRRQKRKKRGDS